MTIASAAQRLLWTLGPPSRETLRQRISSSEYASTSRNVPDDLCRRSGFASAWTTAMSLCVEIVAAWRNRSRKVVNAPASAVYRSILSIVLDASYVRGISIALARGGFFKRTGGISKHIAGVFGESQDGCHVIQFLRQSSQTPSP
jgi:hypothetical protein